MTGLLIALLLIQGRASSPAPQTEIAILTAVVAHLPAVSRCKLSRSTSAAPHRWIDARTLGIGWHVSSVESPDPVRVPDALISAAEAANKSTISLDALRELHPLPLAAGLSWADEGSQADCIIRLSRPGVSANETHALVDVRVEDAPCRCPHGHIYTLEKRNGSWKVVGEGGHWTTECVCIGKQ